MDAQSRCQTQFVSFCFPKEIGADVFDFTSVLECCEASGVAIPIPVSSVIIISNSFTAAKQDCKVVTEVLLMALNDLSNWCLIVISSSSIICSVRWWCHVNLYFSLIRNQTVLCILILFSNSGQSRRSILIDVQLFNLDQQRIMIGLNMLPFHYRRLCFSAHFWANSANRVHAWFPLWSSQYHCNRFDSWFKWFEFAEPGL